MLSHTMVIANGNSNGYICTHDYNQKDDSDVQFNCTCKVQSEDSSANSSCSCHVKSVSMHWSTVDYKFNQTYSRHHRRNIRENNVMVMVQNGTLCWSHFPPGSYPTAETYHRHPADIFLSWFAVSSRRYIFCQAKGRRKQGSRTNSERLRLFDRFRYFCLFLDFLAILADSLTPSRGPSGSADHRLRTPGSEDLAIQIQIQIQKHWHRFLNSVNSALHHQAVTTCPCRSRLRSPMAIYQTRVVWT